jgi:hypothetical protein
LAASNEEEFGCLEKIQQIHHGIALRSPGR